MPRLWNDTIETHRRQVREAILDTTWTLAAERGLAAVTMSEIAEKTGIGRATLYKYFPDVEAILIAWHQRQIARHLALLATARDEHTDPARRLRSVLDTYARIHRRRTEHQRASSPGHELVTFLHAGDDVAAAHGELHDLFRDVLADAVATGEVRDDVPPAELADYCLSALAAAGTARSDAALGRLVDITLAGLHARVG
jgi:AcrR family transcriptional regulator